MAAIVIISSNLYSFQLILNQAVCNALENVSIW